MKEALIFLCSFFMGSIPVGFLVARANGIDIRTVGSGNVGATNVMRNLGKKWGIVVFLCDVLKGFIPAMVGGVLISKPEYSVLCGVTAVFGHCLSPFLGFRGGKGIATGMGALLGSLPVVALICFGLYALFFLLTRYVSVASLIAISGAVSLGYILKRPAIDLYALWALWALIVARHKGNIERLLKGEEPKFYAKRTQQEQPKSESTSEDKEQPSTGIAEE